MRVAPLVTLLLGLVLGSLIGYRMADDDDRARGANRNAAKPAPATVASATAPARAEPNPVRARTGEDPPPASGMGTLAVDPSRLDPQTFHSLELARRDMRGEEMSESMDEGEHGIYRIEAYPAAYSLTWYDGQRTRGLGIRIRAGETTTVRLPAATAPIAVAPIPDGFGRLTVRLVGADGGPIPHAEVEIVGRGISEEDVTEIKSEPDGTASIELRPGRYQARIGCLRREFVVREGEQTVCVCDHAEAGEVRLPREFPGRLVLRGPDSYDSIAIHLRDWRHRTVAFVRPGNYRYGLRMKGQSGADWDAGSVFVQAGRITRLDPPIPTGSFELTIELSGRDKIQPSSPFVASLKLPARGRHVTARIGVGATGSDTVFRGSVRLLPPGVWDLWIKVPGYHEVRERVSIGSGKSSRHVRLERKQ